MLHALKVIHINEQALKVIQTMDSDLPNYKFQPLFFTSLLMTMTSSDDWLHKWVFPRTEKTIICLQLSINYYHTEFVPLQWSD